MKRVLVVLAAVAAAVVGGATGASAMAPELPSNCWAASPWYSADIYELSYGVAGYCQDSNGTVEWYDSNGGYGVAWWYSYRVA